MQKKLKVKRPNLSLIKKKISEKEISKLAKKGKSKKDDQKRMQKEQELKQIANNLDKYARESLKKSVLEQNKRYGYVRFPKKGFIFQIRGRIAEEIDDKTFAVPHSESKNNRRAHG